MGLIITELFIIPLPAIMYVKWKGAGVREAFRFKGISLPTLWKCALITLCIYPAGLFLNLLGSLALGMLGELLPVPVPVAESGKEYIINILVIALAAGVSEEVFFRGFILKGYERLGERKAIVVSAVLFGIFHFNIQNFIGPIFLGIVFGVLAVRTGSIAAPAVGHFINNAVSVTFMFIAGMVSDTAVRGYEGTAGTGVMTMGLVFWGVLAMAGGYAAIGLIKGLKGTCRETVITSVSPSFKDFIPVVITAVVFIVLCISELMLIMGSGG